MAKNTHKGLESLGGLVFSTNRDQPLKHDPDDEEVIGPGQQDLRVTLDRKHRKGKVATIVTGFRGPDTALSELGKMLKTRCGVGGSAKDGEIIIQGDHAARVLDMLLKEGFKAKRSGG
ncbi:MAG: translation initiation factor [Flavobacteriales bacterium]|nr:translation initiation factor [Flavobacteriales bacterium]